MGGAVRAGGEVSEGRSRAGFRRVDLAALACCLLFVLIGACCIDSLGVQTDEALFAAGIYGPFSLDRVVRIFHHDVPLMVMTYVGTVKSLLYRPIFAVFAPSAFSVRFPALLLGALSIWFFYRLLLRILGPRAALVGCALLATDPMYLMTVRYDWGPVAIQHVCLVGALLSLLRFHQEKRARWLALGFFALGLGMWDKALFAWLIAGMVVAAMVTFPREVIKAAAPRNLALAVVFFALGAFPLIKYNVKHRGVTFGSNTAWSTDRLVGKARLVKQTAQGAAMYGVNARDLAEGPPREPSSFWERTLVRVNSLFGQPRRNWAWPVWIASLLLLPLVWRKRAGASARFALVFILTAWSMMAFIKNTGDSVHHTILLWPMPQLAVAAVLSAVSFRFGRPGVVILAVVIAVVAVSSLAVIGTYYAYEIRYGGNIAWTDAFYPFSAALIESRPDKVFILEWGFFDNLRLFSEGRLHLYNATAPIDENGRRRALEQIADERNVFVTHDAKYALAPGITVPYLAFADESGYERADLRTFADRNGRNMIEVFRFRRRSVTR